MTWVHVGIFVGAGALAAWIRGGTGRPLKHGVSLALGMVFLWAGLTIELLVGNLPLWLPPVQDHLIAGLREGQTVKLLRLVHAFFLVLGMGAVAWFVVKETASKDSPAPPQPAPSPAIPEPRDPTKVFEGREITERRFRD